MIKTVNRDKRKTLNQILFLASRKACSTPDDRQAVVWVREGACESVTQRTRLACRTSDYKDLTLDELNAAIQYLQRGPGTLDTLLPVDYDKNMEYATNRQLAKLHYLAQACAVFYAPTDITVKVGDGTMITGESLRREIRRSFECGKLRGAIAKHCYSSWINPAIHSFLKDSGLRYKVKKPTATYYVNWSKITREEANELIKRFQKICNELTERYGLQSAVAADFSNN